MAGIARKAEKFCNIVEDFAIEIEQRGGNPYGRGRETGVQGTGGGSFKHPCPPPQVPVDGDTDIPPPS